MKLMYVKKIYFPIVFKQENEERNWFFDKKSLYLIDFQSINKVLSNSETEKVISLTYTNLSDFYHFVESLSLDEIKRNYVDGYIDSRDIDLSLIENIVYHSPETISFEINENILNLIFKKNIKEIRKRMKLELNRDFEQEI